MDEYIRKQEAVEALDGKIIVTGHKNADTVLQYMKDISNKIKSLKPADVAPVVHAKWEHVKHKSIEHGEVVIAGDTVRCSACRHAEKGWHAGMNFCPECGAKMDA